jgi:hypothetical protein
MEADCKRFELNQGGRGCDEITWRKVSGMGDSRNEVIGGQKNSLYFREGKGDTIQLDLSQVRGKTTQIMHCRLV